MSARTAETTILVASRVDLPLQSTAVIAATAMHRSYLLRLLPWCNRAPVQNCSICRCASATVCAACRCSSALALLRVDPNAVFAALNRVLGKHRWAVTGHGDEADALPKAGCRYARTRKSVLRRGRVLEIIRPVSLTLYETLYDPPCRVRLQLRWRIHSLDTGSLLHLVLSYQLNGAAALRARTLALVDTAGFAEYFSPTAGTGHGAPQFSWTAALTIDLAYSESSSASA